MSLQLRIQTTASGLDMLFCQASKHVHSCGRGGGRVWGGGGRGGEGKNEFGRHFTEMSHSMSHLLFSFNHCRKFGHLGIIDLTILPF